MAKTLPQIRFHRTTQRARPAQDLNGKVMRRELKTLDD